MQSLMVAFGPFTFDDDNRVLFRGNTPVSLGRPAALLLSALLERRGAVLTKSTLLDAAWPRLTVEESNLAVQVAKLRRVLGKNPAGGDWIATVAGVGYRFVPEAPTSPAERFPASGQPTLAILAFHETNTSISGAADAVVEDLTTALAQFKSLTVAARHPGHDLGDAHGDVRRLAGELGVRYVLEGSLQQSPGRPRIAARLIDGESGALVWAQIFDEGQPDGTVDGGTLAARLAATVEAEIHAAEIQRTRRDDPERAEAYSFYLKGRAKLQSSRPDDNLQGYRFYLRALELEPDNVEFLAAAAEALHHRLAVGWAPLSDNDRRLSREHVARGIDLVGTNGLALSLFGLAMMTVGDEDVGLATAMRAAEINSNSPLVLVVAGLANVWGGDLDEAARCFRRSLALNPTDPTQRFALDGLSKVYCIKENFGEALRWAQRAHAVSRGLSSAYWNLIASSAHLKRMDDARRYLERYQAVSPGVTIARIEHGQPYYDRSRLRPILSGLRLAGLA